MEKVLIFLVGGTFFFVGMCSLYLIGKGYYIAFKMIVNKLKSNDNSLPVNHVARRIDTYTHNDRGYSLTHAREGRSYSATKTSTLSFKREDEGAYTVTLTSKKSINFDVSEKVSKDIDKLPCTG